MDRNLRGPTMQATLLLLFIAAEHAAAAVHGHLLRTRAVSHGLVRPLMGTADRDQYEELRAPYDRAKLLSFFGTRPLEVARRGVDFASAYIRVKKIWDEQEGSDNQQTRGEMLRQEVATLGPVAVKFGQTLSQRPDLVPDDVCEALKSLQMENAPFANVLAWRVLAEELETDAPIAPGPDFAAAAVDPNATPVFASLSADPVAAASLGQVYRGMTHDGIECAVKVQRPEAMRQVALDIAVCALLGDVVVGLGLAFKDKDLDVIIDTAAEGIFQELDYRIESANADAFRQSMSFLGYVDVPRTLRRYSRGPRVLVTEWARGRHLDRLSRAEGLRMTYMAVEAVTASIMVTGIVHADPHEGNVLLSDDGRLVFLDFGLMSTVEPQYMEAFAIGIQAVVNKDYAGLVDAFVKTRFVRMPLEYRSGPSSQWQPAAADAMAADLRARMEAVPGGTSRFGALATVLIEMGAQWKFYSPPYVVLLIRTFVTLEGIAGQVDDAFNIYEVALPWAIQRALSPASDSGARALRDSLLTRQNQLQWERLTQLLEQQAAASTAQAGDGDAAGEAAAGGHAPPTGRTGDAYKGGMGPIGDATTRRNEAGSGAMSTLDTVRVLLGSPEGCTLRRIARDIDSTELLLRLVSREAQPLRRRGVQAVANGLQQKLRLRPYLRAWLVRRRRSRTHVAPPLPPSPSPSSSSAVVSRETKRLSERWPVSDASVAYRQRRTSRYEIVVARLARLHIRRQLQAGARGFVAISALAWVTLRVGLGGVALATMRSTLGGFAIAMGMGSLAVFTAGRVGLVVSLRARWIALSVAWAVALAVLGWRSRCNAGGCDVQVEDIP